MGHPVGLRQDPILSTTIVRAARRPSRPAARPYEVLSTNITKQDPVLSGKGAPLGSDISVVHLTYVKVSGRGWCGSEGQGALQDYEDHLVLQHAHGLGYTYMCVYIYV